MPHLLPLGSSLRGRYRIHRTLHQSRLRNLYIAEGGAVGWPADFVRVVYAGRTSMTSPAAGSAPGWVWWAIGGATCVGTAALTWAVLRKVR